MQKPCLSADRTILHIDFDSFFASVEQQYNPELRNKPIGVTATNGRSCIIAASREAKKFGVVTASRTFDATRRCPQIRFVSADFVKYWEVSKKFVSICKDYSPYVEVFSIDELFIDVTKTTHLFGGLEALIAGLKKRIRESIGVYITVSIGISHNKLLAKLASGMQKPNGVVTITDENRVSLYKTLELTAICGIGERIKLRLNKIGIYTLLDLENASLPFLIAEFGTVEGRFLKNVGLGIDESPVIPYTMPSTVKSVGRNYCLPHNEYNQRIVLQNVFELSEEIGIKLRRLSKKAKTIGLSLRGSRSEHGQVTSALYIHNGREIFESCLQLYKKWLWGISGDSMVRQISVWATNLSEKDAVPLSLFSDTVQKERLLTAVDALNARFGDHTIRAGFLLYADKLTTVPNGWMADRYERQKLQTLE